MDIIYKQLSSDVEFRDLGIENCYLKHLCAKNDSKTTTRKEHHHTGFEIHFMNLGHQKYLIDDKEYEIKGNNVLIIPPLVKHYVADTLFYESKFSITFNTSEQSLFNKTTPIFVKDSERIFDNLKNTLKEYKISSEFSRQIILQCIYETLVILLRECGFKEKKIAKEENYTDDRLAFAKRYIKDNIDFNIAVSDVAAHCSLSEKQLTRIFKAFDNTTPLSYIHSQKIRRIEELLSDGYSLKETSEKMNFSSEYYFNSFYKKHSSLTPGMFKKNAH